MRRRDLCLVLAASAVPLAVSDQAHSQPPVPASTRASVDALLRLTARLRRLEEDGLDPAWYAIPADEAAPADPRGFASSALRAAGAALSDLLLGRVRQPTDRPDILRDPAAVPMPRWQLDLLGAAEPAAVIDRAALVHPEALAIRTELARARAILAAGGWGRIPAGPTIEPGSSDPDRVPALRARLRVTDPALAAAEDGGALYDPPLAEAVRRWQEENGLEADGRVGAISLAQLNRPVLDRVNQLRVALDMRRAAARPPAGRRIDVNIPDYRLQVMDGTKRLLRMNVVVGRPSRATPLLQVRMTTVQFNPPWGVPERNAREDLLPKLRRDVKSVVAKGFHFYTVVGGERVEIDPATVDWNTVPKERFPYLVRQDAGDESALGRLKFIMPNNDDIYLHDTPDRAAFNRPDRAFSSGCIRLERPMELLTIAMDGVRGWDDARIRKTLDGGQTVNVPVARPIPVHLIYSTAVVEDGHVRLRPDIYGLDAAYARELARPAVPQVAAR
ncbi:L,D-transpeptidase family protein [Roseomonas elaeocarpi]|uniref:Murein L,D-transpeptidase n=1 Tax=Roseomonas elaeocarpi TaxID=907779 RepID=A0ABV6JRC9_9PROT